MRDVVAADSSVRLVLAIVVLGLVPIAACKVSIPSGVFSCADGKRCPPRQVCDPDKICRDNSSSKRDAAAEPDKDAEIATGSDSGADAALEDAATRDSGGEAGGGSGMGGAGGTGGKAGEPAAGSGGTGGSAGQGTVEDFQVASSPLGVNGVLEDFAAGLKLTFSTQVDADTITSDSVKVTLEGVPVAGMLNVSRAEVTFKPEGPWTLATKYEVTLTSDIHDASGRALEPSTLTFTTRDGKWTRAKRVDGSDGVIAMAGDGFAILAWSAPPANPADSYPDMWAAQFTPPSTWSAPVQIKSGANGQFLQSIVVNRHHHAAVAWTSISNNVVTTAYTTGPGWGPDAYVSQTSYNDHMVLNEDDELMVVADSPISGAYGIKGVRFTLGAVSPTSIDVGGAGGNNTHPGIALLDGTPRVIWQHAADSMAGAATQIVTGTLNTGSGTPLSANGVTAANAVLAGDPKQTSIIAIWEQADPSWTNVWASRMVIGANWSAPVRISDDQSSASNLELALDPSGRAVAVWRQAGGIASSHFSPGTGWSAAEKIAAADAMNIDPPQLALDAAGNGIATWTQDGSPSTLNEVWVARYLRDGGWQAARRARVSDVSAGTSDKLSLAADDYGRAFVMWTQENAIWSGRFE